LVTGARKGIGRYLVDYYASKGLQVIGCSREPTDYKQQNYTHYCLDVCDEINVKHLMASIRKDFQRLDVLINNAGVASMNSALLTPLTTVQKTLNTNVVGTFLFAAKLPR
jgi:3-oxoacyl-[acyl-carrier protein] reductase